MRKSGIYLSSRFNISIYWFFTLGPYEDGKPDATFSFTDDDFDKVASGKMNPQFAFMRCLFSSFSTSICKFGWIDLSEWMKINSFWILNVLDGCRGAIKIKGSISAAQKFTPYVFSNTGLTACVSYFESNPVIWGFHCGGGGWERWRERLNRRGHGPGWGLT